MKNFKKVLALVLVVAMMMSFVVVASAKDYTDEAKINYDEAVDVLSYLGVLGGYPAGDFRPANNISRAEAAKIIAIFKNGDANISDLYKAANPFADVKGNWAESYVAYCAQAGIVSGRNETTFDPDANVTGIEFLKMALVVLGFDADAEEFKGANWKANVLSMAKEAGLLIAGWDPAKAITREEAAQVMLNALQAEKVEYGYKTSLLYPPYVAILTSKAGAYKTGAPLAEDWKVWYDYDQDVWGRPFKYWAEASFNAAHKATVNAAKTIGNYPVAPVKEYIVETKKCDALVDLGIAKTSTKAVDEYWINGKLQTTILKHEEPACKTDVLGGQGTLTQTFFVNDKYYVTEIATWLAKVTAVNTIPATFHVPAHKQASVEVYNGDGTVKNYTYDSETLKVGDYLLVTRTAAALQDVELASPVASGKFVGYTKKLTKIGDTTYDDAAKFWLLNPNNAVGTAAKLGDTYNVFADKYGNIIGLVVPTPADKIYAYGLISAIAFQPSIGLADEYIAANLMAFDTTAIDNVVIGNAWKDCDAADGSLVLNAKLEPQNASTVSHDKAKNSAYYDALFRWSVDGGKYVIADKGVRVGAKDVSITNSDPWLRVGTTDMTICNDNTQYLIKTIEDGKPVYTYYVGYKTIPSIKNAEFADIYDDAKGAYGAYVFIDATNAEAIFTGLKEIAVIFDDTADYHNIGFDSFEMWIDGAKVLKDDVDTTLDGYTAGTLLYYVNYDADGKILSVDPITTGYVDWAGTAVPTYCDGTVIRNGLHQAYNCTDMEIIVIDGTTVSAGAIADVIDEEVYLFLNSANKVVTCYVIK